MTRTKEIEVWYQQYLNDRLTVMMRATLTGETYAHMNNGQFETLYIMDDPGGRTKLWYTCKLETTDNSAIDLQG